MQKLLAALTCRENTLRSALSRHNAWKQIKTATKDHRATVKSLSTDLDQVTATYQRVKKILQPNGSDRGRPRVTAGSDYYPLASLASGGVRGRGFVRTTVRPVSRPRTPQCTCHVRLFPMF